jgi:hypothetical protein
MSKVINANGRERALLTSTRAYTFDFTKKFVKVNGQREDKCGLAYWIGNIDFNRSIFMPSAFTYEEIKQKLYNLLHSYDWTNVTIITKCNA